MVVVGFMGRRTDQVVDVVDEAAVKIRSVLPHGEAGILLISRTKDGVVLEQHLVLGVGHVEVGPQAQAVCPLFVESHLEFITCRAHLSFIDRRRCGAKVSRNGASAAKDQDIVSAVMEEVYGTCNQSAKETIVDAKVRFAHGFPFYILIAQGTLAIP